MHYAIRFTAAVLASGSSLVTASPVVAVVNSIASDLCTYDGCADITPFCSSYLGIATITTTDTATESDTLTITNTLDDATATVTADTVTETDTV